MPQDGIRNARIANTYLGIEDHGIFTSVLDLDYGGTAQGFGNWGLKDPDNKHTGWCAAYLTGILETVGVESWEKLRGQIIRVDIKNGLVMRIGHVIEDRWFDPKELHDRIVGT